MVADFDFRGMADILGTHIGFLEADFEAKVYTYAGEFGDEPLQCCLEIRCEGSIVSEEQVTHKCSFDFGFSAEASHVEEFTVGRVWRYTLSGIKGVGQEERGEDSKKVSGIRDSSVSRRSILSKSFKGHGAYHAFVVLGRGTSNQFSRSWIRPFLVKRSNALVMSKKAR